MKTINANVGQKHHANGYLLSARRMYGTLDTSAIKRDDRRKARRELQVELSRTCYQGIQKDFSMSTMPVVAPAEPLRFLLDPANAPTVFATVTVIRKRPMQRSVVEQLLIPA